VTRVSILLYRRVSAGKPSEEARALDVSGNSPYPEHAQGALGERALPGSG